MLRKYNWLPLVLNPRKYTTVMFNVAMWSTSLHHPCRQTEWSLSILYPQHSLHNLYMFIADFDHNLWVWGSLINTSNPSVTSMEQPQALFCFCCEHSNLRGSLKDPWWGCTYSRCWNQQTDALALHLLDFSVINYVGQANIRQCFCWCNTAKISLPQC